MSKMIENQLKDLSQFLLTDYKQEKDYLLFGLMGGRAGITLAQSILYLNTRNNDFLIEIEGNCDSIIQDLNDSNEISVGYANGIAGIGWLFLTLKEWNIIEYEIDDIVDELDVVLEKSLTDFLHESKYDILHEALGLGVYFLKRGKYEPTVEIIQKLEESGIREGSEIKWSRFDKYISKLDVYDFGLAHGMSGILYFLGKCYFKDIERERCKALIDGIISFYFNNIQDPLVIGSYFPDAIPVHRYQLKNNNGSKSRVGWCYGDLGITHTIFLISKWTGDIELYNQALIMLKEIAKRRGFDATLLSEAGLCHGSSGNGTIFLSLFRKTNYPEFLDAAEYYLNITLEYGSKYGSTIDSFTDSVNRVGSLQTICLLTGITGPALFFSTYLGNLNTNWEESLFLG